MNEDSRDLRRYYRGRNSISKSQNILCGGKHPKDEEANDYTQELSIDAPWACCHAPWTLLMRLGHGFYTHIALIGIEVERCLMT
jgi:hypothetical protein